MRIQTPQHKRYTENTPGILEPRYKEELFALLNDPASQPPIDHPLFARSREGIKILNTNLSNRTGVINEKFDRTLLPAKTKSHHLKNEVLLHQEYNIPKDFDTYRFEAFCWYMLRARTREALNPMSWEQVLCFRQELVTLNPTLDMFTSRVSPDSVYHILCGVASQFNIDDIQYFVFERFPKGGIKEHSTRMNTMLDRISRHYGYCINSRGYVPSPRTLNNIEIQLNLPPIR